MHTSIKNIITAKIILHIYVNDFGIFKFVINFY